MRCSGSTRALAPTTSTCSPAARVRGFPLPLPCGACYPGRTLDTLKPGAVLMWSPMRRVEWVANPARAVIGLAGFCVPGRLAGSRGRLVGGSGEDARVGRRHPRLPPSCGPPFRRPGPRRAEMPHPPRARQTTPAPTRAPSPGRPSWLSRLQSILQPGCRCRKCGANLMGGVSARLGLARALARVPRGQHGRAAAYPRHRRQPGPA